MLMGGGKVTGLNPVGSRHYQLTAPVYQTLWRYRDWATRLNAGSMTIEVKLELDGVNGAWTVIIDKEINTNTVQRSAGVNLIGAGHGIQTQQKYKSIAKSQFFSYYYLPIFYKNIALSMPI